MDQNNQVICFLCGQGTQNVNTGGGLDLILHIHCNICGHIKCSDDFMYINTNREKNLLKLYDKANRPYPEDENQKARIALSYFFKTKMDKDKILTTDNLEEILSLIPYPTSLLDKIDRVLEFIYKNTYYFGQEITINYYDFRLFFCKDIDELIKILKYLNEQEYIKCTETNYSDYVSVEKTLNNLLKDNLALTLLTKGIKYIEESGKNPKSNQCFVAMWFDDGIQKVYSDIIKPTVETDTGYKAMRIDNKEHINYITDEIIKEIRRSKFMIADLTGCRAGVYYEAGFAFGLGIPVIFTCRKDWENNIEKECGCKREGIHFDIRQRNIIFWEAEKLEEFKTNLTNRIGAVVGLNQ